MNKKTHAIIIIFTLLFLQHLNIAQATTKIMINKTPPQNLGVQMIGTPIELGFNTSFIDTVQSTAIIIVNLPPGFNYTGYQAFHNQSNISNQFTATENNNKLTLEANSIQPTDGTLNLSIFIETETEGNYTITYEYYYIGYKTPPDPPITEKGTGNSNIEIVFGKEYTFYKGWNLIGIPYKLRDTSINSIFGQDKQNIEYIFSYQPIKHHYTYWLNGLPAQEQNITTLNEGTGYWIYAHTNFKRPLLYAQIDVTLDPEIIKVPVYPTGSPLNNSKLKIGVISSTTNQLDNLTTYYEEIIKPEINHYLESLGYNSTIEFVYKDANSSSSTHLEKVQELDTQGIDYIIGGRWSSQAQASLNYCNENNILLFSPSSSSPLLSISDDNLLRMSPTDNKIAYAVTKSLEIDSTEAIILIHRNDSWANGIANLIETEYTEKGGIIYDKISYPPETLNFTSYKNQAENSATSAINQYSNKTVKIITISFNELSTILSDIQLYPHLHQLNWISSNGWLDDYILDENPQIAADVRLFEFSLTCFNTSKYHKINTQYNNIFTRNLSYYDANEYDIVHVIVKTMLETQSQETDTIINNLPKTASDYYGITGWTKLDEHGDRYTSNYDIYITLQDGSITRKPYFRYIHEYDSITIISGN